MDAKVVDCKRMAGGSYRVMLECPGGWWVATYAADGRLAETVWSPGEHVPRIDPAELDRMADLAEQLDRLAD